MKSAPTITICQLCGEHVPVDLWPKHQARHMLGQLPSLPIDVAFERGMSGGKLRRGSLRTFFDARFRGRWWVLVPLCWGLLLAAAALTWWLIR